MLRIASWWRQAPTSSCSVRVMFRKPGPAISGSAAPGMAPICSARRLLPHGFLPTLLASCRATLVAQCHSRDLGGAPTRTAGSSAPSRVSWPENGFLQGAMASESSSGQQTIHKQRCLTYQRISDTMGGLPLWLSGLEHQFQSLVRTESSGHDVLIREGNTGADIEKRIVRVSAPFVPSHAGQLLFNEVDTALLPVCGSANSPERMEARTPVTSARLQATTAEANPMTTMRQIQLTEWGGRKTFCTKRATPSPVRGHVLIKTSLPAGARPDDLTTAGSGPLPHGLPLRRTALRARLGYLPAP